jgi:hypothetical protein
MLRPCCLLLILLGCSDKPKPPATAGSGSSPAQTGSVDTAKPETSLQIPLPKLSGNPPQKTTKPHEQEQLERLSKLEIPHFARDLRRLDTGFLDVKHVTELRKRIGVQVTIMRCVSCKPMEVETWRADKDALMVTVLPELREQPDTEFHVGEHTLGGQKLIYTYQLGFHVGKDEIGNVKGGFTNAYILYHNDGVNQIRVIAAYEDDGEGSKEHLAQAIPRDHLEAVATAFLDAYTQAWGN